MKSILVPNAALMALLAFLPLPALAVDLGWTSLATECRAEFNPSWAIQAEKGKSWEADSLSNLEQLRNMSDKVCPEYFRRPNDSDAIQLFNTKKAEVLDHSPKVEKEGNALNLFIVLALREYQATFAPAQIDFSKNPCAVHLKKTATRTQKRLQDIRARVKTLTETCFSNTAKEAKSHVQETQGSKKGVNQNLPHDQGKKTKSSDITGTKPKH